MHIQNKDNFRITAGRRKNCYADKPYEDALWLDPLSRAFCVADGITCSRIRGTYPNPSPASFVATTVVSAVASAFFAEPSAFQYEHMMVDALRTANQRVRDYVLGYTTGPTFSSDDIPGAVATVLVLNETHAFFAHLGDCVILHFPNGDLTKPVRLTEDQTARARQWLSDTAIRPREAQMRILRATIRNVKEHPLSFGALCGQDEAMHFVQTGRVRIGRGDKLLMFTDGLEQTFSDLKRNVALQKLIADHDVDHIMDFADRLDQMSSIRSDDKTLIIVESQG